MPKIEKIIYFENLNAIRGIAFSVVFVYHFYSYVGYRTANLTEQYFINNLILQGHLGVNLFFVLSGFLITYLLMAEKADHGKINIIFFYARRVLRIWPLFFLVLIISFFVFPLFTHRFTILNVKDHLVHYLFFVNNFDLINTGFVGIGTDNLGVLWSVAVEEQFYLFWPVLLFLLPQKYYPYLFTAVIAAALVYRNLNTQNPTALYFHTLSVMSDLAVGAVLAYSAMYQTKLFRLIEACKRLVIVIVYVLMISAILFLTKWSHLNIFTIITERLIISLFFAFVIGEQCFAKNSFFKVGRLKFFSFMGTISYGLYCLHMYCIVVIQKCNVYWNYDGASKGLFFSELFACLAMSIFVCYLSYNFFEKKILKFKIKFAVLPLR